MELVEVTRKPLSIIFAYIEDIIPPEITGVKVLPSKQEITIQFSENITFVRLCVPC